MNAKTFAERRNSLEIIVSILNEARTGVNKTRLVYRTNLNFLVIKKYIDLLTNRGLLQVDLRPNPVYVTTEKGLKLVEEFTKLNEMLGVEPAVECETL